MYEELIKSKIAYVNSQRVKVAFIDPQKEKEIVVYIRLQHGLDKPEMLDFITRKFRVDPEHAETLYYKALPEGLSREEFEKVSELSQILEKKKLPLENVNNLLDTCFTKSAASQLDAIDLAISSVQKIL